jgi:serine/threonine-protein kinase
MPGLDPTQPEGLPPQDGRERRYTQGVLINGKYLLEARIGSGGMGTVWLAQNLMLESAVAVKMIDPGVRRDETLARFRLEACVEARFKHPNIVRVFDFGHTELGDPFIVMELLDGITLGDLIRERGGIDPAEAVKLILPIVDALCHVHAHGVVHRDVKPDNILLSRDDVDTSPKLLDFGVAKLMDRDELPPGTTDRSVLIGSPSYMAPEQAKLSEHIDHRADIWSVCVVLYEAISGRQAFPGEGIAPLRDVVETNLPPLDETGAGELELFQVLERGLEKDPELRFQSMDELGTELAQWLYDRGEREDLNGSRLSRTWRVVAGGSPAEFGAARPRRDVQELRLVLFEDEPSEAAARERARHPWFGRSIAALAIVLAAVAFPSNARIEPLIRTRQIADAAQLLFARLLAASADVHAMIAN